MMRHCFVREEGEILILCQGVPERWLAGTEPVTFGPAPTTFGPVSISVAHSANTGRIEVSWQGAWHGAAPAIQVRMPGFRPHTAEPGAVSVKLVKADA
jgi:hypothetical protein